MVPVCRRHSARRLGERLVRPADDDGEQVDVEDDVVHAGRLVHVKPEYLPLPTY